MMWEVLSSRLAWPAGTKVSADDLAGCNIGALVEGGHLAPVKKAPASPVPDQPKANSKRTPVDPVPDDTAEQPEEQE
jgi:hypothetical protein